MTTPSAEITMTLPPVQGAGEVLRVNLPGTEEYFLVANRQRQGSDAYIPQTGLLIWHIDPLKAGLITEVGNRVNVDPAHKGVDVEEADGVDDLDFGRNRGDSGDPFPGSSGAAEFTSTTYPSSDSYAGSFCSVGIRSIRASGGDMSFTVSPSERVQVWGDLEGDRTVDEGDVFEAFWYALGWRGGDLRRTSDGDVDGDGDVDIRDGFMIDVFQRGGVVPSSRLGSSEIVDCSSSLVAPPSSARSGRIGRHGRGR